MIKRIRTAAVVALVTTVAASLFAMAYVSSNLTYSNDLLGQMSLPFSYLHINDATGTPTPLVTPTATPTRVVRLPNQEDVLKVKDLRIIEKEDCKVFPSSNPYICFRYDKSSVYVNFQNSPINLQLVDGLNRDEISDIANIVLTKKDDRTAEEIDILNAQVLEIARTNSLKFKSENETIDTLTRWRNGSALVKDIYNWLGISGDANKVLENLYIMSTKDAKTVDDFCGQDVLSSLVAHGCQFNDKIIAVSSSYFNQVVLEEAIHATGPERMITDFPEIDYNYKGVNGYLEIISVKGFGFKANFHPKSSPDKITVLDFSNGEEVYAQIVLKRYYEKHELNYTPNYPGGVGPSAIKLDTYLFDQEINPVMYRLIASRKKGNILSQWAIIGEGDYKEGFDILYGEKGIMPKPIAIK